MFGRTNIRPVKNGLIALPLGETDPLVSSSCQGSLEFGACVCVCGGGGGGGEGTDDMSSLASVSTSSHCS